MDIDWGRRVTVSVDRRGERLKYTFCRDPQSGWCLGFWNRLAPKSSGDWQVVESWNRLYSRDAWQPDMPDQVLTALKTRLEARRRMQAAGAIVAVVACLLIGAWSIWH